MLLLPRSFNFRSDCAFQSGFEWLSVSLPLRIVQWSFHIRPPRYHAEKTLVKKMSPGLKGNGTQGANPGRDAWLSAKGDLGRPVIGSSLIVRR
jgi:hypothetical protein